MRKIIVVRHGETQWNRELRYQGQTNVDLNEEGIRQVERLAQHLKDEKIESIYSSDLKRAYKTAEAIAKYHSLKIKKTKLLREIHYGIWEGMYLFEVKEKYPEILSEWIKSPFNTVIPEGESIKSFARRIKRAIDKILKETVGNILIVSHGGPIKIILTYLLGMDLSQVRIFRQDNTALNIIEEEGERRILTLMNDTCHLKN